MLKKKLCAGLLLGAMMATVPSAALAETMMIDLGNPVATVDGTDVVMHDVAGISKDGVILVPVRDVAEAFGGTVLYDGTLNQVKLTFPNGNWADITIQADNNAADNGNAEGIVSVGTFMNDRLYIPADLMATCLGGRLELVDYGRDNVYRLIYHVR